METLINQPTHRLLSIQKILSADTIMYLKGEVNYTHLVYRTGKKMMIAHTLKRFEESLKFQDWIRIHRAYLINPRFIASVSYDDFSVELKSGIVLPIARRRLLNFKDFVTV